MAYTPTPVYNSDSPTNPNIGYSTSGGASGVQDWWVFVQTVDIMYQRNNQYDMSTSSLLKSPTVTSNWMDMNCTVQTQGDVYYNMAFSSTVSSTGNLFQPQVLQIQTNTGVSGGFGENGAVSTSSMGIIRRPARKDAAGTILDPTGICTESVSLVMDQMPGAYNSLYDTSSTVNSVLAQAMGQLAEQCENFKPTLVEL